MRSVSSSSRRTCPRPHSLLNTLLTHSSPPPAPTGAPPDAMRRAARRSGERRARTASSRLAS
eukprot:2851977-Rhodomonas_salina.1